jgi:hypothetical protein
MTTAFTAIPEKMTISAIRFFGDLVEDMARPYPAAVPKIIDLDQRLKIICGVA